MRRLLLLLAAGAAIAFGQFDSQNAASIQGRPIQGGAPSTGNTLVWNGTTKLWEYGAPSGAGATTIAGDVTGTLAAASVVKIRGLAVKSAATCAADGYEWRWVAASNYFDCLAPGAPPGGGGPPPASSQLGDFWVVRTSATVLTIGPACSSTYPCKIAFGTSVFTLSTPATATISAGTDSAYIYVSDAQVLSVGVNSASFTCSGCTRVASITNFPATSFPLWTWTSTSGTWDLAGGTDGRTFIQKGADPLASYLLAGADTQLKNGVVFSPSIGATFGSFESGATALSGSKTACVRANWAGTITSVTLDADVSGSVTVGVLKKAGTWTGTAGATSIAASAIPALSSAVTYTDSTLTGWTTTFAAGDNICFALSSPTTVAGVKISLKTTVN